MKNAFHYILRRTFIAALAGCVALPLNAQMVGGRQSGQGAPKEVKPSELSKGGFTSDVSLFSGALSSSYSLGSVSTPGGQSFALNMSYTGSFATGDNIPVASGIPYGEGWSVQVPTISVSSESYYKYTESELVSYNLSGSDNFSMAYNDMEAKDEGELYWFSPRITIPGVISENFVFKYYDLTNNESVFVPNKFSTYVEARLTNKSWRVILGNGDVYLFGITQLGIRNASNQRVGKNTNNPTQELADDGSVMFNLVVPKEEVLTWYCTELYNPNSSGGQKISFAYQQFGQFDYYKEFMQPRLDAALRMRLLDTIAIIDSAQLIGGTSGFFAAPYADSMRITVINNTYSAFVVCKDILLTEVGASDWNGTYERIELKYKTQLPASTQNMLDFRQAGVARKDSLYNYAVVYSQGVEASELALLGLPAVPAGNTNFSQWWRYHHIKSTEAQTLNGNSEVQFTDPNNPYVGAHNSGTNAMFRTQGTAAQNIPFNHGFLESPRVGANLPPGDIYELRSLIYNGNVDPLSSNGFCSFDINLASGGVSTGNQIVANNQQIPDARAWSTNHGESVFSTFNQAVKWNSLSNQINSPTQQLLVTSNLFVLPNLPTQFNGFNIQIGPGNSDHDYSFDFATNTPVGAHRAYWNERYTPVFTGSYFPNDLEPCDAMRNNFGIGLPWHNMRKVYGDMDNGDNNWNAARYNFWWKSPGDPASRPNTPTRADANVQLKALVLIRYSKNPYMLAEVNHYIVNGEVGANGNGSGEILTSRLKFSYEVQSDTTINNRIYAANQPSEMGYIRNVFLLKKIQDLPVNAWQANANMTVPADSLIPTTQFFYSRLVNPFFQDTTRTNADAFVMTKVIDQLGGETTYEYYPLNDSRTPVYVRNKWRKANIDPLAHINKAPSVALQITPVVKAKTIASETDSYLPKRWEYDFINPINRTEQIPLPDNFRNVGWNISFGFETAIVYEPRLVVNGTQIKTVYTHFTAAPSNGLLYGMVKKQEVFDEYNRVQSRTENTYGVNIAYYNGIHRATSYEIVPSQGEYDNYYSSTPVVYLAKFDLRATSHWIPSLEGHKGTLIPPAYLHSYFVRALKTTSTEFDYTVSNPIYNIIAVLTQPNTTGHSSNLRTSNPNNQTTCGVSALRAASVSTITEYEYWEADSFGGTMSNGYKLLLDFGGAQRKQLQFEPSWMLYRSKSYSQQHPDAWGTQENFYYYDIKNQYGEATYDFDALYKANLLRMRGLSYQTRATSKASGQAPIASSNYSFYDYRWNQNPDELLPILIDTVTGPPCAGNPPPVFQDTCVKYFGQPPPPGMVLTEVNGQYYYCFGEEIPNPNRTTNPGPNDPPPPIPNQGYFLAGKLYFRAQWAQVDTIPQYSDLSIDPTDAKILRFVPVVVGQTTQYLPKFPFVVLETYRVNKRNELGLVKEEQDESGIVTKYWYHSIQTIWHVDVAQNGWCNSYLSRVFKARGLPYAVTVGFGHADSSRSEIKHNADLSIDSLIRPNDYVVNYSYDSFGRMKNETHDGKLRGTYNYKYYNNNTAANYSQRSSMNYVETYILLDENSTVAERCRSYLDPLGRSYDLLSQVTSNYQTGAFDTVMVHKGQTDYDNWGRTIKQYKPFKETNNNQPVTFIPKFNSQNQSWSQLTAEQEFEPNKRSRTLKGAKYGENINGNHTVNTSYQIINGQRLILELNLQASEVALYMPVGNAATYRFRKQCVRDEDGKTRIQYSDMLGNDIAIKAYIKGNQYAVTLFAFDSRKLLVKVINPIKEQTTYSYNLLGLMYKKTTVNSGISKYMYNKKGQVVIHQDANGQAGTDNNAIPYYTVYSYDDYGRLIKQERANMGGNYGPLYYADINDNSGTLVFSAASSCDFSFNYVQYLPNSQTQPISPYTLLSVVRTEKEIGYDFAVSNTTGQQINNSLHTNLQATRTTNPQTNLRNRVSYDISYDKAGNPVQYHLYSYNKVGQLVYEMMQFAETGITASNRGICGIVRYTAYNLRGAMKAQVIDADANGTNEVAYTYTYDGWNRLKEVTLNNAKLADYQYDDALGLIKQMRYYDQAANCIAPVAVDTIRYTYDQRDRLTALQSHLYEEYLFYDNQHPQVSDTSFAVAASQNWNGLINASKSVYKANRAVNNPGTFNGATIYGYQYDGLNRLTQADASVMDVLTTNPAVYTPKRRYGDEALTYDKAGNILTLTRGAYYHNNTQNPANWVAQWNYIYQTGTSRLIRIDSTATPIRNFTYDANGSLRTDSYNSMSVGSIDRANLISEVTANGELLKNLYSVSDQRIFKQNSSTGNKTFYWLYSSGATIGVLTPQNNSWAQGTWEFYCGAAKLAGGDLHFSVSDHLGNTRVTYTTSVTCPTGVISYTLDNVIDYYAFGKKLREYVNQKERYQYSGKERDEETGLDYFGARFYDANVGRFLSIDPLESKYYFQSTYAFAANNPVCLVDINGEGTDTTTNKANKNNTSPLGFSSDLRPSNGNLVEQKFDQINAESSGFSEKASTDPMPLYKKDLISFAQKRNYCNPCNDNELGTVFENITYQLLIYPLNGFHNMRYNTTKFTSSTRNTVPDFIGDQLVIQLFKQSYFISNSAWVEAKAKTGNLYVSSNIGQIRGHIDNLANEFLGVNTGVPSFTPHLHIITTADTYVSPSLYTYATSRGVKLVHFHVYYTPDSNWLSPFSLKKINSNF
ncbi:MAG: RHS repeat-associated core domain-containing protein [Bacteroidia bacterium]|jgi:RHS repeat-associated protein|nr:RHS repeat-associated core domain-containing protein [Bacteroidia bacterium]